MLGDPEDPAAMALAAIAERIASLLVSIPVTARPGRAACRANPPTPQYRSHIEAGDTSSIHADACAYSCVATDVFVWKK
ncbi:hypothetical protein IAE22_30485, partial [Bacillus sp. S34]|nr:hypothetical protein [Bacillus sp. S34]